MLRVSKQTDYGLLLLTALVRGDKPNYSARELAGITHLPTPMVGKILKVLTRAGVLESRRGIKGGYQLSRAPGQISLVNIVDAIEGPIAMTECIGSPGDCEHEDSCPVQVNWLNINILIKRALEGITLQDMTGSVDLVPILDGSEEMLGLSE